MALIKEPSYGLVYNTDGTLCTTYRDDDVPFPGVRSFAVETATTNLITNMNLTTWPQGDTSWDSSYERLTGEYFMGQPVAEFGKPGEDRTVHVDRYIWQTFSNLTEGDVYTFSIYVHVIEAGFRGTDVSHNGIWIWYTSYTNCVKFIDLPTNKWVRVEVTGTVDSDLIATPRIDFDNSYIKLACPQFEKKPFATSFVEGSRPAGRLVISVDDLKFDIANDDWVISYWKYPVATNQDTQNGHNRCSLGQKTSDRSKGYIYWGKEVSANKYYLYVVLNDATVMENFSDNTFNPTDYFYHWHYEVMKKQGKTFSYYVDGVKQCEATIPADKKLRTPFDVGLSLGGNSDNNVFYPQNALIAAPYYGYNSATWTDEYIREVYEAKIPYPAQNKLSIY